MNLAIVVPCYNEEEVLQVTAVRLLDLLNRLINKRKISENSIIYFVDDGSSDSTWNIIRELSQEFSSFRGIKLSRNRGHQAALLAGLMNVDGDAVISVDADLQDDLNAIEEMVDKYISGVEIVYGVRASRNSDAFFKRLTAEGYYRVLQFLGVDIVFNHADYRLLGRRALQALHDFGEVNVFLRGIIPLLGFSTAMIYYDRNERYAGESKYPLGKMFALAFEGITSFSAAPLRAITMLGIIVSVLSLGTTIWALGVRLFTDNALPGWASTVIPIYFLGGVQLLCIGIIGEYLAKVYMEVKHRPRFLVEQFTWDRLTDKDNFN